MWQQVYQTKFHNTKELNQRMLDMRHGLKQSVIDDAFGNFGHQGATDECRKRPYMCNRTTLWHSLCSRSYTCSAFVYLFCEK